jgi:hypothetical protein
MNIILKNRLAQLIRQRNINSASEFARRMTAAGFKMSSSHASRYEKEDYPAFDKNFISTACNLLQCLPSDFFEIVIELDRDEELDPMIVLPRSSMVIKKQSSPALYVSGSPIPVEKNVPEHKAARNVADEKPKTNKPQTEKIKPSSQAYQFSEETGPTGMVFPFKK